MSGQVGKRFRSSLDKANAHRVFTPTKIVECKLCDTDSVEPQTVPRANVLRMSEGESISPPLFVAELVLVIATFKHVE